MRIESIEISKIQPAPYNPRKISKEALRGLGASLAKFGYVEPIIFNERTGRIVGGHQRFEALKRGKPDLKGIECVIVDFDEVQERALNIALNNRHIAGEWDLAGLSDVISGLDGHVDFEELRFDVLLEELKIDFKKNQFANDDENISGSQSAKIIKRGDLIEFGNHRLLCDDSINKDNVRKIMNGKTADIVFTDPPYGVSYADKNRFLNAISSGNRIQEPIENDHLSEQEIQLFWKKIFENIHDILSEINSYYITGPQKQYAMMQMMKEAGIPLRHVIIWAKNNHVLGRCDYHYQHEPIFFGWTTKHKFYGKGSFKTSVWHIDKPLKNDLHPTMKPIELVENALLNSSEINHICFDPFLGSGTTVIACEKTNRSCYGIEISESYCEVIIKRWCDFTGNDQIKINDRIISWNEILQTAA